MKIKKYLKLRYLIILFLFVLAFCNGTAIKIYKNYIEYYKLNRDVKVLTKQNDEYKKRLYYLENKPSYLERKSKFVLNVIAEDEVEYRFINKKPNENKNKQ
ncbi:septum formation initiator family protein [Candidatus Ruminimicrobium bovinum]|uniref:septum formation initiator family protein n=1 Tax=Candidatus Ruminimicrobium bovinum TaxID=3242779 RepID=UPI0039B92422